MIKNLLAIFDTKRQSQQQSKDNPNNKTNTQNKDSFKVQNKFENGNKQIQETKKSVISNNNNYPTIRAEVKKPSYLNNKIDSTQKEINKSGMLNNNSHPVIGSKFIEEIGKLKIYDYPKDVTYSKDDKSIALIFVGQTGAGKSTFINAYLNHLLNISENDNIRYKIIRENTSRNQTQSQTTEIITYNIKSLRYKNKLFQLIDTPGAADTKQRDEEFVKIYQKALDSVEKLNSIVFVYNASDVRYTEIQKKVVKNITNLFANNIYHNCLAVLTHANNEFEHDAVQLLKDIDVFKEMKKSKENWYFPVNSISYFFPFEKGDRKSYMIEGGLYLSEDSFKSFTERVFGLKELMTLETQKNLKIKNQQKDIINTLETNLLNVLFVRMKTLKDVENQLQLKINEIEERKKDVKKLEEDIKNAEESKALIANSLASHQEKLDKIKAELAENEKKVKQLESDINSVNNELDACKLKQTQAEKDKQNILNKKNEIDKKINELNQQIAKAKNALSIKETDKNEEKKKIKDLEELLEKNKNELTTIDKNLKEKENEKERLQKDKNRLEESQKVIKNQIDAKKEEENKLKEKRAKEEKEKNKLIESTNASIEEQKNFCIKKKIELKDKLIKKLREEIDKAIEDLNNLKKEKVAFTTIKLIDDPNNERNLTCTKCKSVCHKDCSCYWGVPIIRPVIFCNNIQSGKCIICKCSKDVHNRKITSYINEVNYRDKTEKEKKEIDNKINSLEKEFREKQSQYEKKFEEQINLIKNSLEFKKELKTKEIENKTRTNTVIDINFTQREIDKKQQHIDLVRTSITIKENQLNNTVNEIESQKTKKDLMENKISQAEKTKSNLNNVIKNKEILIEKDKTLIKQTQAQKDNYLNNYNKEKNLAEKKIDEAKKEIQNKTLDLAEKQRQLTQLKGLKDDTQLKNAETNLNQDKQKLKEKDDFIKEKGDILKSITDDINNTLETKKAELEKLQKEKKQEAGNTKEEIFRKLCIINILNKEIEKITLNKTTISSIEEIMDRLSLKFLDDRPLFMEIIKEFKDIKGKYDKPNPNPNIPNPLYVKFGINEQDYKNIGKKK